MKRMSLQWRLTCITTLCIAIICGCLTMFVYKNGVHYIDSLQDAVESQGDEKGNKSSSGHSFLQHRLPHGYPLGFFTVP